MKAERTLAAINLWQESQQVREHRSHLGASTIGKKCSRAIAYSFRWAALEEFSAKKLRVFEEGNSAEAVFISFFKGIGCRVWERDPSTGLQWRISFGDGHGGGSCDGIIADIPDLPPNVAAVGEFKTHNQKSYNNLVKQGLCNSHSEHFAQTQTYGYKLNVPYGIYCAVNKNTSELHFEIIQINPGFAQGLIDNAERIILSETLPPRVGGAKGPDFYLCHPEFCKFRKVCWLGGMPDRNCRTCEFSKPMPGGVWVCQRYNNYPLDKGVQHIGCADYKVSRIFKT